MELALVGDGAAREQQQQVRLKLHFEDRSILSAEQLQDGLADSWFLVARYLRSISDLASHIIVAFALVNSCPHGISLRMENFTLPPSQSVWLLKDKDIVSVHKKYISPDAVLRQVDVHSSSLDTFDKIAPLGVKVRALEEFERETGGYESEQEEENNSLEARQKEKTPKTSSTKAKRKKRKREKMERADEQGVTTLHVVPYTGGLSREEGKGKKSKKQRRIVQEDDNKIRDRVKDIKSNKQVLVVEQDDSEKVCEANETPKCAKDKNIQEPESSNAIKKKKKQLNAGDDSLEQPTIQKQHALKGSSKNVYSSMSNSSSDEKAEDEERKSRLPSEAEKTKKLSRSTLRKKAKRRWRREHGELVKTHSDKLADDPQKGVAYKDVAESPSLNFTTKLEDDGDAEEERLPRVVRPGHIRFGPLDEDGDGLHSQHSLPLLAWSNGLSKRKGQSWGQEKTKRGSKNRELIDDMEICDTEELKFEELPALKGTPQNGDVIAYRMLELTSSFCPELTEYRVGKVVDMESQSGALKLAEVPKYPLRRRHDAETNEDAHLSSLYDEEGFLETQIYSLADIRIVEGCAQENYETAPTKELLPELATTEKDINLNTSTLDDAVLTDLARAEKDTNFDAATADANKTCSTDPNTLNTHVPAEENSPAAFQGWPELFEVIEKKKQELGNKDDVVSSGAAELDKPTSENGCSSTAKNATKDASTRQARGGWHRKAGGLGATMALLRSQNAQ